jgi:hypothetical protein
VSIRAELAAAARAVSARLAQLPEHYRRDFDAADWTRLHERVDELAAGGNTTEALAAIEDWRGRVLSSLPKPRARR